MKPKFTEHSANERTFLAWIRTALALIAAGAAVTSLLPQLGEQGTRAAIGLALLALGTTVAAGSYWRWDAIERALRRGTSLPTTSLTRLISSGVVLVALIVMILIMVDLL